MYHSPDCNPCQGFELCHLTFLRAIYGDARTEITCNHDQQGEQLTNSNTIDIKTDDLLQENDVIAIQTFLHEREKILSLKEHTLKIKLMYEESLLQFHPEVKLHYADHQKHTETTVEAPGLLSDYRNSITALTSINVYKDDESGLKNCDECHSSSVPIFSLSHGLKKQYAEAEARVSNGTEQFRNLVDQVQRRVERLENVLRKYRKQSITNRDLKSIQNFVLETQYKLELWILLMKTVKSTLSI